MSFHRHFLITTALVLSAAFTLEAQAAGATPAEAQAHVNAAIEHFKKVGKAQAIDDFNNAPEWKAKGLSLLMDDANGVVLAASMNEKLRGKATIELKDPSGKEFVKDFISTAKKGGGWVDYQFINPESKQIEMRTMYVRSFSGFDGFFGTAITKQ